ncbi:MAG: BlaI/MecI/CopY family transcriptional regulator [Planctomycetota bacterium]
MDKPAGSQITEGEWDILKALWDLGPTTARQAADHLRESRDWAYSTVKTMLDRMVAKGLVKARQVGNVWEYTPAVDLASARTGAWKRFVDAAFGGAVAPALAFIAGDIPLTKGQREQLLALLKERTNDK